MFTVLNVREPKSQETTRLVFGCVEPAQQIGDVLLNCGFEIETDFTTFAPDRSADEKVRAEQLVELVMSPVKGRA